MIVDVGNGSGNEIKVDTIVAVFVSSTLLELNIRKLFELSRKRQHMI